MTPRNLLLAITLTWPLAPVSAQPATGIASRPASPEELARLVRRITTPSYQVRDRVFRAIAEIGPAAIPLLRRETNRSRQDVALAARELIEELEEVFFSGVTVRLEADPPRAAWDEAIRLTVFVENPTSFEARIPWALPDATTTTAVTTRPKTPADQVGMIMDVAAFLEMMTPDGQALDLRVDSLEDDRDVKDVVEARADDGGPVSVLPPGRRCTVVLADLNRGWSRYPLLASGRYRVRFVYQPEWTREEWIAAGVGKVVSNTAEIEITRPAPEILREAAQPVDVIVGHEGGWIVARLLNRWDRPVWVNLNLGDGPLFARVQWRVGRGESPTTVVPSSDRQEGPASFDVRRLRLLKPCELVEVARIERSALPAATERTGSGADAATWRVAARYDARSSREVIREAGEKAAPAVREAVRRWAAAPPHPVVTGSPQSHAIRLIPPAATGPTGNGE